MCARCSTIRVARVADRQMGIYKQSGGDIKQVQRFLVEQTMQGISLVDVDTSSEPSWNIECSRSQMQPAESWTPKKCGTIS